MARSKITEKLDYKKMYPLNMNRLHGRVYRVISRQSKKEILIVKDHVSTIEKWIPLSRKLIRFGNVTIPDIPGVGGMDSFSKIRDPISLERYADYLASFIRLRYKHKKIAIVCLGSGFVITTKMLQKYPSLQQKVELLFNVGGYISSDELNLSGFQKFELKLFSKILQIPLAFNLFRIASKTPPILGLLYLRLIREKNSSSKLDNKNLRSWEFDLKYCDSRSFLKISRELLKTDNRQRKINLEICNIYDPNSKILKNNRVRKDLSNIFKEYCECRSKLNINKRITIPASVSRKLKQYSKNLQIV